MARFNRDEENRAADSHGTLFASSVVALQGPPMDIERRKDPDWSQTKTEVVAPRYQLTRGSVDKSIEPVSILGSYVMNLPHRDGLLSVSRMYDWLEVRAFNYQQENVNAWFETNADLLEVVLSDSEKLDQDNYSRANLRRKYKVLCRRLAHWMFNYLECSMNLIACVYQLAVFGDSVGKANMEKLSSSCRPSYYNARTQKACLYPVQKGLLKRLDQYSRIATGSTDYGAAIVCLPFWDVSVYGNCGQHCMTPDAAINIGNSADPKPTVSYPGNPDNGTGDTTIDELLHNLAAIQTMYGDGFPTFNAESGTSPKQLHYENGTTIIGSQGSHPAEAQLNCDGNSMSVTTVPGIKLDNDRDSLAAMVWNNFYFWQSLMDKLYVRMRNRSDRIRALMEEMDLIESPRTYLEIWRTVQQNNESPFEMDELMKFMRFKASGKANTATIIRWAPPFFSEQSGTHSDTYFETNFNRYPVDFDDDIAHIVEQSKRWPQLTPTVFSQGAHGSGDITGGDDDLTPTVLNGTATYGIVVPASGDVLDRSLTMTGKIQSLYDVLNCNDVGNDHNKYRTRGMDADWIKSYVDGSDAFALAEDPFNPRVFELGVFDDTDPFKCGFGVILDKDDKNPNEWSKYLRNPDNYLKQTGATMASVPVNGTKPLATCLSASATTAASNMRKHVANDSYMDFVNHAVVFIGEGIFHHPIMNNAYQTTGHNIGEMHGTSVVNPRLTAAMAAICKYPVTGESDDAHWLQVMMKAAANVGFDSNLVSLVSSLEAVYEGTVQTPSGGNASVDIIISMFSPDYPRVNLGSMVFAMGGLMPSIPDVADSQTISPTSNKAIYAMAAAVDVTALGAGGYSNSVNRANAWDFLHSPLRAMFYFMERIEYRKVYRDLNSDIVAASNAAVIDLDSASSWWMKFIQPVDVQFMGAHDTKYLWDFPGVAGDEPTIGSGSVLPEDLSTPRSRGLLVTGKPRSVAQAARSNGARFTRSGNPIGKEDNKTSGNGKGGFGSQGGKPSSKSSHNNKSSKRWGSSKYFSKMNRNTVKEESDGEDKSGRSSETAGKEYSSSEGSTGGFKGDYATETSSEPSSGGSKETRKE